MRRSGSPDGSVGRPVPSDASTGPLDSGDLDGDGIPELVVSEFVGAGTVYVFSGAALRDLL